MAISIKESPNCITSALKNTADQVELNLEGKFKNFSSLKNTKKRGRDENHGCYKEINRKRGRCDSTSEIITSSPDHDGYQWRKYGEKTIMNSQFSRCYYRCTYSREFDCKATKQVQQQNNSDPAMYKVTYFSDHSCTKSTAHSDSKSTNNSQFLLDFSARTTSSSSSSPVDSSCNVSNVTDQTSSDNEQERSVNLVASDRGNFDGFDQLGSMWFDSYELDFFNSLFENHDDSQQSFLMNDSECCLIN